MNKTLFTFLLLASFIVVKAQTKNTDVPDLDKIEIKEPDSVNTKTNNKVTGLDVSITEEKDVVPTVMGHPTGPGEYEPEFPGGDQAFFKYISSNIKVPKSQYIRGKVIVQFVIDRDGHIINTKILYGQVTEIMKEEILRVFNSSPVWKPGIQNKRSVKIQYTMPLSF